MEHSIPSLFHKGREWVILSLIREGARSQVAFIWFITFNATRSGGLSDENDGCWFARPIGLLGFLLKEDSHNRLTVFRSDSGITLSFGEQTYFINSADPFHNIALKAIQQDDYIPFYVEIARREGLGAEFRDALIHQVKKLSEEEE